MAVVWGSSGPMSVDPIRVFRADLGITKYGGGAEPTPTPPTPPTPQAEVNTVVEEQKELRSSISQTQSIAEKQRLAIQLRERISDEARLRGIGFTSLEMQRKLGGKKNER